MKIKQVPVRVRRTRDTFVDLYNMGLGKQLVDDVAPELWSFIGYLSLVDPFWISL